MKILITGATGLVGKAIIKESQKRGYQVNFLTTSRRKLEFDDFARGFYWNPAKGYIDPECFEGVEVVINLAGASITGRWSPAYKRKILESRTRALSVLKAGIAELDRKPEMLISASAIGYYPHSYTEWYQEDFPEAGAGFLGEVVKAWEKAAFECSELLEHVALVRIGLVLDRDEGALPQMVRPVKWFAGAPAGSGEQWQSWIHIEDLAAIFLFLAENRYSGIYNGVAPNPVTNTRMVHEIAEVLRRKLWMPAIPAGLLRLVLGEMAVLVLNSQRVSSRKLEQAGYHFRYPKLMPALENLLCQVSLPESQLV